MVHLGALVYLETMSDDQEFPLTASTNERDHPIADSRIPDAEIAEFELESFPVQNVPMASFESPPRKRMVVLPATLFVLTCLSTFWVGVREWSLFSPLANAAEVGSFMNVRQLILANWDIGLTYMAAVVMILLLHELGHFFATIYYRVPASYPFFLPFPINPIGTLGAVIGMQGFLADRKQIFDIGIAGPLAGLVLAVPIAYFGVSQLDLTPQPLGGIGFRLPLIMDWFAEFADVPGYQRGEPIWLSQLNPLFVAGWVGMLITGLNMMPIGQLDGGHITYALFGKAAHTIAQATIVLAIAFMVYHQNFMLGIMVVLILVVGTNHPPTRDDSVPLGWFRCALGLTSLMIPFLCFPPLIFKIAN